MGKVGPEKEAQGLLHGSDVGARQDLHVPAKDCKLGGVQALKPRLTLNCWQYKSD